MTTTVMINSNKTHVRVTETEGGKQTKTLMVRADETRVFYAHPGKTILIEDLEQAADENPDINVGGSIRRVAPEDFEPYKPSDNIE